MMILFTFQLIIFLKYVVDAHPVAPKIAGRPYLSLAAFRPEAWWLVAGGGSGYWGLLALTH
jgi:hypothetical protein